MNKLEWDTETKHEKERQIRQERIRGLKTSHFGHVIYHKRLSYVCQMCMERQRLLVIRNSMKCQLDCKFCYFHGLSVDPNYIQPGCIRTTGIQGRPEDAVGLALNTSADIAVVRWLHFEPLLELETLLTAMHKLKELGVFQTLNTNGLRADKQTLLALRDAGLKDIRFNLAATMCGKRIMKNMKLATEILDHVGVETPIYKESKESLLAHTEELQDIEYVALQELQHNTATVNTFGRTYRYRGLHVSLYDSVDMMYDILETAVNDDWDCGVLSCDNRLKWHRMLVNNRFPDPGVPNYQITNK